MSTTRTPAFHIGDRVIAPLSDGPGEVVGITDDGLLWVAFDGSADAATAFRATELRREPTI